MPKSPILNRIQYFSKLPGRDSGAADMIDWNGVETELGTMVEPRQISGLSMLSQTANIDVFDAAANSIVEIQDVAIFQVQYSGGTIGGDQLPREYRR